MVVSVPKNLLFSALACTVSKCSGQHYGRVCGQSSSNYLFNLLNPIRSVSVCIIEGIVFDFCHFDKTVFVIIKNNLVTQRQNSFERFYAVLVSQPYILFGNIVTALSHTVGNTQNAFFHGRKRFLLSTVDCRLIQTHTICRKSVSITFGQAAGE